MARRRLRLATRRKAVGLSQERLAELLGVDRSTIGRWEAAETEPQPWLRPALAAALGVDIDELRTLIEDVDQPPDSRDGPQPNSAAANMPSTRPSPEEGVATSQAKWQQTRQYLIERGIGLAAATAELYDRVLRVAGVPAIAPPNWLPTSPVPLDRVTLRWQPSPPLPEITGAEAEARPTLPLRAPGRAFERYTTAIRYLRPPALFENRHSYRLTGVTWDEAAGDEAATGELIFGLSTFFDKLDLSEPISHEAAQAAIAGHLDWPYLPFRSLIADPFDLDARPVNPGISTLTIRRSTANGSGTFLLLRRDPTQVTNGRHYSLLPAGEFQPASISPESVATDLDLWRNMVREYSEEMLGEPEHDGSSGDPIDYEVWPFFRDLTKARSDGKLHAYVLGVVIDALSLNASIATVVVIDDDVFDDVFRHLVTSNPEGEVVHSLENNKAITGLPFNEETVTRLITREPLGQTSAACLSLAWRHRRAILQADEISTH